jgi:proline racemase
MFYYCRMGTRSGFRQQDNREPMKIHVVDSQTGGERARIIVEGGPKLGSARVRLPRFELVGVELEDARATIRAAPANRPKL